ncbi:hypothetical protein M569_03984 [Genlisea aurea]|uniref:S-protein homolog n=1 Tax=Genlisea aurea TaxID=192259 RepID=S8CTZ2_9LAMI|nr:hypothetical protein M569_03984 [Genlisea aurea]
MQKHSIFLLLLLAAALPLDAAAAGCTAPGDYKFTTVHIANYLPVSLHARCASRTGTSTDNRSQDIAPNGETSFSFCPQEDTRVACELSAGSLFGRFAVFDGHFADKGVAQYYWIAKPDGIFYYNDVDKQVVHTLPWNHPHPLV